MYINRDTYALVIGTEHSGNNAPACHSQESAFDLFSWLQSGDGGAIPKQNMQLLLSPSYEQIQTAFHFLGIDDTQQIGRLLMVIFSGYAHISKSGEFILEQLHTYRDSDPKEINFSALRKHMESSGSFRDHLWIIDYINTHRKSQNIILPEEKYETPGENISSLLLAHNHGEGENLLTPLFRQAIEGRAANRTGSITSHYLVQYLNKQFRITNQEESDLVLQSRGKDFVIFREPSSLSSGTLEIEVPVWVPSVTITDNNFQKVMDVGSFEETPDDKEKGKRFITNLLPGIYTITIALGNSTEQQAVSIFSNKKTVVGLSDWKNLSFKSVAPLTDSENVPQNQINQAEKLSQAPTWKSRPSSASRLFLFVRSINPERDKSFFSGLKLINDNGEVISNFTTGIRYNTSGGWFAFNADLPPGDYLIRRGRQGVPVRYQPIHLAQGWETHVFLTAKKNYPSLSRMSLSMTPYGDGFDPSNDSLILSEVLMNNLRGIPDPNFNICTNEIWKGNWQKQNLWLGVVAASSLSIRMSLNEQELEFYNYLLGDLDSKIHDHPDVRALQLDEEIPAEIPFYSPPLLAHNFRRVITHARIHSNTIPPNSLSSKIIGQLNPDSPWTAWTELEETDDPSQIYLQEKDITQPFDRLLNLDGIITQVAKSTDEPRIQQKEMTYLLDSLVQKELENQVINSHEPAQPPVIHVDLSQDFLNALDEVESLEIKRKGTRRISNFEESIQTFRDIDPITLVTGTEDQDTIQNLNPTQKQVLDLTVKKAVINVGETSSPTPIFSDLQNLVLKLQTEANRMQITIKEKEKLEEIEAVNSSFRKVIRGISERMDCVVYTDSSGKITRYNDAFVKLFLKQALEEQITQSILTDPDVISATNTWETFLKNAPLGESSIEDKDLLPEDSSLFLERSEIQDKNSDQVIGYRHLIRRNPNRINPEQMQQIQSLLPSLAYSNSLYAYSSSEDTGEYLQNIMQITDQMNQIISQND